MFGQIGVSGHGVSNVNSGRREIDFQRENVRGLRKLQSKIREKRMLEEISKEAGAGGGGGGGPLKARHNNSKFPHVQPKVNKFMKSNNNNGSCSDKKNFLEAHAKTGPFIRTKNKCRRGEEEREQTRNGNDNRIQKSGDFGSDEVVDSVDDDVPLRIFNTKLISSGRNGVDPISSSRLSRFSDMTLADRKEKINDLLSDICSTIPLADNHVYHRGVPNGQQEGRGRRGRSLSFNRLTQRQSLDDPSNYVAVKTRGPPSSVRGSRIQPADKISNKVSSNKLSHNKNNYKNKQQRKEESERMQSPPPIRPETPLPSVEHEITDMNESVELVSEPDTPRHEIPDDNLKDELKLDLDYEPGTEPTSKVDEIVMKGNDANYVLANVESASVIGHKNRNGRLSAVPSTINRTGSAGVIPENYKVGTVPKYLRDRQDAWKAEAERIEREKPDPDCPKGHVKLPETERISTLENLQQTYDGLVDELSRFPVRNDTLRVKERKREIEAELKSTEEAIRTYARPKVFIKISG